MLQCVSTTTRCDGIKDCINDYDENGCYFKIDDNYTKTDLFKSPVIINVLDGRISVSSLNITSMNSSDYSSVCPESHFTCPGETLLCFPVFLRCNGVYDCPGHEDEAGCKDYTCPGYYRCRDSIVCVHPIHLCDGYPHCPQGDDEYLCDLMCPHNCTCYGNSFLCKSADILLTTFPDLRSLDARGTDMKPSSVANNSMLVYLNMARCHLRVLHLPYLPNLRILDVSDNSLTTLADKYLTKLPNLLVLLINRNPVTSDFLTHLENEQVFPSILHLEMSKTKLPVLNTSAFRNFPNLQTLNLSNTGLTTIRKSSIQLPDKLRVVDLRGCSVTDFPKDVFRQLSALEKFYTDSFRLCCPEVLPAGFNPLGCQAPPDLFSACTDLLRSSFHKVAVFLLGVVALLGNLSNIIYFTFARDSRYSFDSCVLLIHLCVSDLWMGLYLVIIGVADRMYSGSYLWQEETWKESVACKAAGFLSLLSSEVSTFVICLIALDRLLVLHFPLRSRRCRKCFTQGTVCVVAWTLGIVLASTPLLPMTSHWLFYERSGVCALLTTVSNITSTGVALTKVFLSVNCAVSVLTLAGVLFLRLHMLNHGTDLSDATQRATEVNITRRLLSLAWTNAVCWVLLAVLLLLHSQGLPLSDDLTAAGPVVVVPLNSAINPCLYNINVLVEKRRKKREERIRDILRRSMATQLHNDYKPWATSCTAEEALSSLDQWLRDGLLTTSHVAQCFRLSSGRVLNEVPSHRKHPHRV